MRNLFIALGLLVAALVFLAGPAYAHADHGDAAAAHDADAQTSAHHGDADDHGLEHNSADHSHPIGEDTYHQKASHSTLDFVYFDSVTVRLAALPRAANLPVADEAACGLALAPPIRPPLA